MDTKVRVKEIVIGKKTVTLLLQQQSPQVEWNNQVFTHLWFLLAEIEELSHSHYIEAFAEISNFFWKGLQFQRIYDIQEFQQHYIKQVELEKNHPADVFPYRLSDFKIFDVSVIHEPKIENNQLIYFVFNVSNGLPYRVVCLFPYPKASTYVHYQILPLLENQ